MDRSQRPIRFVFSHNLCQRTHIPFSTLHSALQTEEVERTTHSCLTTPAARSQLVHGRVYSYGHVQLLSFSRFIGFDLPYPPPPSYFTMDQYLAPGPLTRLYILFLGQFETQDYTRSTVDD